MDDEPTTAEAEAGEAAEAPAEDAETFPREYVEKLRREAAEHRVKAKNFEQAFEGYTPEERQRFLELAADLNRDPERAYEGFKGVAERLADRLGISTEEAQVEIDETAEDTGLTRAEVEKMFEAKLKAEREEQSRKQGVEAIKQQAIALDPRYAENSADYVALLHIAQNDPEADGTLEGAHKVLTAREAKIKEQAIAEYRESLRGGRAFPPVVTGGDGAANPKPAGPPKTFEEARKRAEERMNATFG